MKIYTKIILDKNNNLIKENFFEYNVKIANAMGIHYDFKITFCKINGETSKKRKN